MFLDFRRPWRDTRSRCNTDAGVVAIGAARPQHRRCRVGDDAAKVPFAASLMDAELDTCMDGCRRPRQRGENISATQRIFVLAAFRHLPYLAKWDASSYARHRKRRPGFFMSEHEDDP